MKRIVSPQSNATLMKYGLTRRELNTMWRKQGGKCAICGRDGIPLVIDHEHVRGWIRMEANERKKYVRGLLCRHCNHRIVHKYAKPAILRRAADYLDEYAGRARNS